MKTQASDLPSSPLAQAALAVCDRCDQFLGNRCRKVMGGCPSSCRRAWVRKLRIVAGEEPATTVAKGECPLSKWWLVDDGRAQEHRKSRMDTEQILQEAFRFRTQRLPWYPRRGTRDDLVKVFAQLGFRQGVEIGTQYGKFAATICRANPDLQLTCVDPWSNYRDRRRSTQEKQDEIYAAAVKALEPYRVKIVRRTSLQAVPMFAAASLDFVYIDGNHEFDYVMRDLIEWQPKVRSGGIVALHDYAHTVGDVVYAVDAYVRAHGIAPWYITREELPTAFWVKT